MGDFARQAPDKDTGEDIYQYLLERINSLENRNLELREQFRQMESEKRYIETRRSVMSVSCAN